MKDFNEFLDLLNKEETKSKLVEVQTGVFDEFADENGRLKGNDAFSAFLAASHESTIFMLKLYHQWMFEK